MKKLPAFLFILFVLAAAGAPLTALSPYTTWTLGPGRYLWPSQDAYTPLEEIDLPLSGPEEMFLAPDGSLYIADTGNGRIVRLDADFQIAAEYGLGILESPTGLFVDEAGTLYIADAGRNTILILSADGELISEFGRPSEPLFGTRREFLPRKLVVDARRNLYVVSEGSVDGLVMMNADGHFIGYFGANSADMSLKMILQRLFLTDEQLDQFIKNEAASPSNLALDRQSLIYTITAGTERERSIRRFTVSGKNMFPGVFGSRTFRDIDASEDGLLVTVDADGSIFEYDLNGVLLFVFGGQDRGDQRLGLLSNPTAIERVGDLLYVLDKDKNAIVTYQVTDFARRVHDGVRLYMDGFYAEARPYFEDVLEFNGLFIMAYQAIADAYYKEGDYPNALQSYRYAEDRSGYSETFWELRNAVLQQSLGNALGVLCGGWLILSIFTRLERQRRWLDPVRSRLRETGRFRLVSDFAFLFRFIRQPADSFYDIKHNLRGSLLFALLLYAWVLAVRILSLYVTGFIFSPYSLSWQIDVETEIAYTIVPLLLWNVANYLIATISDGEGRLRHVFIGSAYSLFPYALFGLPIALLSNLLTLNEVFLFTFSTQIMWFWTGLMLVIMVKEIHNYSGAETARNILTTLFTMALFLLTAYILYVLFNQLYEFVMAIIREVSLHG
ncbi:MAG: YIP1 family protein [Anaerolineae bacterium]|nr:YIP1 family protein [Anaerolineae bacterium]NUQ05638.1 YIP1 family protein [Anaerolineae bacterium]